jgi:hypothetical protein
LGLGAGSVCIAIYLLAGPPHDGDLAAQVARANLFGSSGLVPWFAGWYAGFHVGGYSLVTPELMWWLHPAGLGVVCIFATACLAYPLLRAGRALRPCAGAIALTAFQLADLLSGRVTFAAGAVAVMAALLAVERGRTTLAALLALFASLTSPVDGLVAGLVAATYLLGPVVAQQPGLARWFGSASDAAAGTRSHRRHVLAAGLGALAGLLVMIAMFPDPGFEPFSFAVMIPALLTSVAIALLPVGPVIRRGAVLSAALVLGCYLIHSPIGTNATRVPLLIGVPAVVASLRTRVAVLLPVLGALLIWPSLELHHDVSFASDPSSQRSYYSPLIAALQRDPATLDHRVEVVEPRSHWQVVYLEPTVTLARGWERQIDAALNPLFYNGNLNAVTYRHFLDRNAVSAVALPQGTPLDPASRSEAELVAAGLPYLHQVWSDADWRLYAVSRPTSISRSRAATVTAMTPTGLSFRTKAAATVRLRLRYSPYLTVADGSVSPGAKDEAVVRVQRGGVHDLHAAWSLRAIAGAVL